MLFGSIAMWRILCVQFVAGPVRAARVPAACLERITLWRKSYSVATTIAGLPRRRLLRDAALATGGVVAATLAEGSSTLAAPDTRSGLASTPGPTGTPVPGTPAAGTR